jgi:hypothetical protein
LTRDRPKSLGRCIATVLSSLGAQDMLTILDDSLPTISPANAALLAMTPSVSSPVRVHLSTPRTWEVIAKSVAAPDLIWLSKTAPRDIAPLRNLSLLLSAVVSAETTVLIDDDIHGFDLVATHHKISALAQASRGVIVGANIGGINEQDTITKLTDAIDILEKLLPCAKAKSVRDLFYVRGFSPSCIGSDFRYVSAGYLAFRLPHERMFAFPPGYNEDWLWCLLHGGDAQLRIFRSREAVVHDPPWVRRPTREDFLFELVGDLVFDCLEERHGGNDLDLEAALTRLSERLPSPTSMLSTRALELMDKTRCLSQNGGPLPVLEEYGLTVLADMLWAGELDMDGSRVLTDWCDNAIAKQRSFAATLRDEGVMPALTSLLREGTL